MNVLEVKNLNISFIQYDKGLRRRKIDVIKNLNLDIKENEILAVFGASGSGKSLLAHFILDILPYNAMTTGEIFYKGEKIDSSNIENLRKNEISFIPQSINSLNPYLNIKSQLKFMIKDIDLEKKKEIYNKLNLPLEIDNMYPFQLSGGMARKVLLSISALENRNLIIADEPTPGLDQESVKSTIDFFKKIKKDSKSALIITHDINMALQCADRIAIFYDGKIIEIEDRDDFKNNGENLKNPYSKLLIKALPENEFIL